MIDKDETLEILESEFPNLYVHAEIRCPIRRLYKVMQEFAFYTREQLEEQPQELDHCYQIAAGIRADGDRLTQLAIDNVFVHCIAEFIDSAPNYRYAKQQFLNHFKYQYNSIIGANNP